MMKTLFKRIMVNLCLFIGALLAVILVVLFGFFAASYEKFTFSMLFIIGAVMAIRKHYTF